MSRNNISKISNTGIRPASKYKKILNLNDFNYLKKWDENHIKNLPLNERIRTVNCVNKIIRNYREYRNRKVRNKREIFTVFLLFRIITV